MERASEREGAAGAGASFLTSTRGVLLLALASCFLWGSAFPCIKIENGLLGINAADAASQLLFAGIRFVISGLMVVGANSVWRGRVLVPRTRDWPAIALLSLFQTVVQYALFYPGVSRATGVASSIIEASNVFLSMLLAAFVFHQERLTTRKVAGCAVGFCGVVMAATLTGGTLSTTGLGGEWLVFLSAISAATSSCLIKRLSRTHSAVLLSGWQFLLGGVVLILMGALAGGRLAPASPAALALLVYMGFISAAAYTLWSLLLSQNPVSRVSIFGFMNPVFGTILSALLLGEASQVNALGAVLSLVLVSLGIVIANRGHATPGRT